MHACVYMCWNRLNDMRSRLTYLVGSTPPLPYILRSLSEVLLPDLYGRTLYEVLFPLPYMGVPCRNDSLPCLKWAYLVGRTLPPALYGRTLSEGLLPLLHMGVPCRKDSSPYLIWRTLSEVLLPCLIWAYLVKSTPPALYGCALSEILLHLPLSYMGVTCRNYSSLPYMGVPCQKDSSSALYRRTLSEVHLHCLI